MRDPKRARRIELACRIAATAAADELYHARAIGMPFDQASESSRAVVDDVLSFLMDEPFQPLGLV